MLLASLMKVVMRKTLLAALLNTDMSVHYNFYPQPMLHQEQYIKPLGILGIACHLENSHTHQSSEASTLHAPGTSNCSLWMEKHVDILTYVLYSDCCRLEVETEIVTS